MSKTIKRRKLNNGNNGDETSTIAKEMSLDDSATSTNEKVQRKMPIILNREIHDEIFIKLINERIIETTTKNIEKYMLCGIKAFKVSLNYFKRINKVMFLHKDIWLYSPQESISFINFSSNAYHKISTDCILLKPILKAMEGSIKDVSMRMSSFSEEKRDIAFEYLINEGVEIVSTPKNLHEKEVKKLCSITSIKNLDCSLLISKLPQIRSKCSELFLRSDKFSDLLKKNSKQQRIHLPWVKKFGIICCEIENSEITKTSIQRLIKCISKIFPNIESLELIFYIYGDPSWHNGYAKMKEIQLHWFNGFSSNIKGKFEFISHHIEITDEEFKEFEKQENEYIIDICYAVKEFEIHEDFNFKFYLRD